MRFNHFLLVLSMLASSAFGGDSKQLFAPDYSAQAEKTGMTWGPTFKSVQVVNFDHEALRASATSPSITALGQSVTVPSTVSLVVGFNAYDLTIRSIDEHGASDRSYFGKIEGSEWGSFFNVVNGAVAGKFYFPDGSSRDLITRGGRTFLVEMDEEEIDRGLVKDQMPVVAYHEKEGLGGLSSSLRGRPVRRRPCRDGEAFVWVKSILYLYDTTLLTWFGGNRDAVLAWARACADFINLVQSNSLIPQYQVKLVGVKEMPGYTAAGATGGLLSADWRAVADSPIVPTLKAETGAGEVGLFVGVTADGQAGLAGGGFDGSGFPAIHVTFVGGGMKTEAHEDGHNNGEQHQVEDWTNGQFSFNYGWFRDGIGRDIMAIYRPDLCPNGCVAFPVISNPNVLVGGGVTGASGGIPAGVPGQSENWRMPAMAYPALGTTPACVAN